VSSHPPQHLLFLPNQSCFASRQSQLCHLTPITAAPLYELFCSPPNRTVPLHTSHNYSIPCQSALCYITRIRDVPPQVNLICLPHANGTVPPPSQSEMFLLYPIRALPTLANQSCSTSFQSELFQLLPIRAVPTLANQSCSNSYQSELSHPLSNGAVPLQANQRCFTSTQSELFQLLPFKAVPSQAKQSCSNSCLSKLFLLKPIRDVSPLPNQSCSNSC
jgi:hypothetical protein